MEAIPICDGAERISVEVKSEISCTESARDGTLCTAEKPWKNYTEAAIRQWILEPKRQSYKTATKERANPKGWKRTGIQALYYSYLYQMGVFGKRPAGAPYQIRADIRRLDQRITQLEFLEKHGITTREQLQAYQKPVEEKVLLLIKERQRLYREAPESERAREISGELKPLRKEIKLCRKILQQSEEMEERMKETEEIKRQENKEKRQNRKKKEGGR